MDGASLIQKVLSLLLINSPADVRRNAYAVLQVSDANARALG
jgi:hypothetical protein